MAREGGSGGGAFGWTILGILVGVSGTLAVQTLMSNHQPEAVEAPASSASVAVAVAPVTPKIVRRPPANVAAAPLNDATTSSQEDVEDDAAAVGMTSRSRPSQGQTDSTPIGAAN